MFFCLCQVDKNGEETLPYPYPYRILLFRSSIEKTLSSTEVELVAEPDLGIARVKQKISLSSFHVAGILPLF
jgi:hypothetical protein